MGAAFGTAQVLVNGQPVSVTLWDTAGQEEYRSLVNLYFKSAAVAVVVFDLTSLDSFAAIQQWHTDIVENCGGSDPKIIVVGNKLDLRSGRVISEDQIEDLVGRLQCAYFEVSALEGTNIEVLFRGIGHVAAEKLLPVESPLAQERSGAPCCSR
jgi:small GTP-binding protein